MNKNKEHITRSCLIFGARKVPALLVEKAMAFCDERPLVVAADAGWKQAVKNHLTPDMMIGDFDSSHKPQCEELGIDEQMYSKIQWIVLPKEKDDTDLHFAAKEMVHRGMQTVVLLGVLGGRLDHSFASFGTLLFLKNNGVKALVLDDEAEAYCVLPKEVLTLPSRKNCYLSVFPINKTAEGVCEEGVKYPVQNAILSADFPLGVSNEFTKEQARIYCKTGGLFVLVVKKDAPVL